MHSGCLWRAPSCGRSVLQWNARSTISAQPKQPLNNHDATLIDSKHCDTDTAPGARSLIRPSSRAPFPDFSAEADPRDPPKIAGVRPAHRFPRKNQPLNPSLRPCGNERKNPARLPSGTQLSQPTQRLWQPQHLPVHLHSTAARWGFSRWVVSALAEKRLFWGSGRPRGTLEPSNHPETWGAKPPTSFLDGFKAPPGPPRPQILSQITNPPSAKTPIVSRSNQTLVPDPPPDTNFARFEYLLFPNRRRAV